MNLFLVPFGSNGKRFVAELARLFRSFATCSALESIALKAALKAATALALQKAKVHQNCLERRMCSWSDGRKNNLLIVQILRKTNVSRKVRLCISTAEWTLGEEALTLTLTLTLTLATGETVSDALRNKHPIAQGLKEEALYPPENTPPRADPVIFECIDADLIRHSAKQTPQAHQVFKLSAPHSPPL